MIRRVPPITWISAAYASGIAGALLSGVAVSSALFVVSGIGALVLLFRRPWPWGTLSVCALAGALAGGAAARAELADCRLSLPLEWRGTLEGRLLSRPADGSSTAFLIESGGPAGCRGEVRALLPPVTGAVKPPPVGTRIRVTAQWEGRSFPNARWADRSGLLRLSDGWAPVAAGGGAGLHLPLRGRLQERIADLWGERTTPMVEALVLARREHLDPELRDAFATSGTAHLLAISGFHVGVVAALLFGTLRIAGVPRIRGEAGAVLGSWLYVLGIGAPQAAVRAALLMSLLLVARTRGRPVSGLGALSSAFLLILIVRPEWLGSIGMQLSFAGTAGLVVLRRPAVEAMRRIVARYVPSARTGFARSPVWLRPMCEALGAGFAATLATTPLVAWHFGRVSLIGIPLTLVIGPLVALSIPGIGLSVGLSFLHDGLGAFLAGGVGVLLDLAAWLVVRSSELPGASIWVPRAAIVTVAVSAMGTHLFLRYRYAGRVAVGARALATLGVSSACLALLPMLPWPKTLEIHLIDVGQGDAVAVRLPSREWLLFDAGPRSPGFDAGERRVVPYLHREGVRDLSALVLTHPHLDHIGGAPAVLEAFDVEGVVDPGYATGSPDYLRALEAARGVGASWWIPSGELSLATVDDVTVSLLHPDVPSIASESVSDLNELSVVVLLEWETTAVLLTGDASARIEQGLLEELPALTVLKVGHHGSRTSTSSALLERGMPPLALIGVGDGNRFGHPHPEVLARLKDAGVAVYRTDRDGNVRVTIRPGGDLSVRSSR